MKKITLWYWIITVIFAGYMIYSAVPGILMNEKTVWALHTWMGYPKYFILLISWAKVAGALAILVPGLHRIKEWAYAGLFFDLAGAVISVYVMAGFIPELVYYIILPILVLFASYFLWHKKESLAKG